MCFSVTTRFSVASSEWAIWRSRRETGLVSLLLRNKWRQVDVSLSSHNARRTLISDGARQLVAITHKLAAAGQPQEDPPGPRVEGISKSAPVRHAGTHVLFYPA